MGLYAAVVQVVRLMADEIQVSVRMPLTVQVLWYHPAPSRQMRVAGLAHLAVVIMAAAEEASGGGTGSSRAWKVRAAFQLVTGSANKFQGPQGEYLADYINYASANANITDTNWHGFGQASIAASVGTTEDVDGIDEEMSLGEALAAAKRPVTANARGEEARPTSRKRKAPTRLVAADDSD